MKKKIVVIILAIFVTVGLYAYYQFNKPHPDIAASKPVVKLTAEILFSQFENNEMEANKDYNGKIIEVTGIVSSIEKR
jgi:hypothetical protein